jgi:hypothetical protein
MWSRIELGAAEQRYEARAASDQKLRRASVRRILFLPSFLLNLCRSKIAAVGITLRGIRNPTQCRHYRTVELPVPAAPNTCDACANTESAVMLMPATVIFKLVSEAWEST